MPAGQVLVVPAGMPRGDCQRFGQHNRLGQRQDGIFTCMACFDSKESGAPPALSGNRWDGGRWEEDPPVRHIEELEISGQLAVEYKRIADPGGSEITVATVTDPEV